MTGNSNWNFKMKKKYKIKSYLVCGSFQLLINGISTCVQFNRYKIACIWIDHSLICNDIVKKTRFVPAQIYHWTMMMNAFKFFARKHIEKSIIIRVILIFFSSIFIGLFVFRFVSIFFCLFFFLTIDWVLRGLDVSAHL